MVGTPHGVVFSRSIRRVPKEVSGDDLLFQQYQRSPVGTATLELKEES